MTLDELNAEFTFKCPDCAAEYIIGERDASYGIVAVTCTCSVVNLTDEEIAAMFFEPASEAAQ